MGKLKFTIFSIFWVACSLLPSRSWSASTDAMAFHFGTVSSISYLETYSTYTGGPYDGGSLIVVGSGAALYLGTKTASVNDFAWNTNALSTLSVIIPMGDVIGGTTVPSQFGHACGQMAELAKTKGWAFRFAVGEVCNGSGTTQFPLWQSSQATCNPGVNTTACSFKPANAYSAFGAAMYSAGPTYASSGNHMCGIQVDSGTHLWLWIASDTTAANTLSGLWTVTDSAATPNAGSFPAVRAATCGGAVSYVSVTGGGTGVSIWQGSSTSYTSGGSTYSAPKVPTHLWLCFNRVMKYLNANSTPYSILPACKMVPEP